MGTNGKRICGKYYNNRIADRRGFESGLHKKTTRMNARPDNEIIMYNSHLVLFKFSSDVHFYVIASSDSNELIINAVLSAIVEAATTLLRGICKEDVEANLDLILLGID